MFVIDIDMRNSRIDDVKVKKLLSPGTIFSTNLSGRHQIKKVGANERGKIMILCENNKEYYFYDLLGDQSLEILN